MRPRRSRLGRRPRAVARSRACGERLATPDGIVLLQPAYSRYRIELGEISSYPPGYKENASIFCHTNPWITLCWCLLGEGDRALETYLAICPSTREERIDTYRCEPYVYAQMIAGPDAATPGRGEELVAHRHGRVDVRERGAGAARDRAGLRTVCGSTRASPADGRSFRVTRRFRGTVYEIEVRNPDGAGHGVRSLMVDGLEYDGNVVPPQAGPGPVRVEVVLGAPRHGERERLAAIGDTARHGVRGGCTS